MAWKPNNTGIRWQNNFVINKNTCCLKIMLNNQTNRLYEVGKVSLPWARNTRSSASWEKGIPVDFTSSTKASLRVGGCTALLDKTVWNENKNDQLSFGNSEYDLIVSIHCKKKNKKKQKNIMNEWNSLLLEFYAANWLQMWFQTSLSEQGWSYHLVYTWK